MTLTDTGPLYALIDRKQAVLHRRCSGLLPELAKPLITTWPCFTEAMFLAYGEGGRPMQKLLWSYNRRGLLQFYDLSAADAARMEVLMGEYADTPMDLADASLVVTAEVLGLERIFTLDSHFYAYRRNGRAAFEVVP